MKVIEEALTTLPLGIQALDLIFPSKAVPNNLKLVAKTFVEKLISERSVKRSLRIKQDEHTDLFGHINVDIDINTVDEIKSEVADIILCSVPWRRTDPNLLEKDQQSLTEYYAIHNAAVIKTAMDTGAINSTDSFPIADYVNSKNLKAKFFTKDLILRACELLSDEGIALFNVHPLGLFAPFMGNFSEQIEKAGFCVNGFLNFHEIEFEEVIAVISKRPGNLFAFEIADEASANDVAEEMAKKLNIAKDHSYTDQFLGFKVGKILSHINGLETRFDEYKKYCFFDLLDTSHYRLNCSVSDILNAAPVDNSIFIKVRADNSYFQLFVDDVKLSQDDYAYSPDRIFHWLKLKDFVTPQYLQSFFSTEIGRMIIDVCCINSPFNERRAIDIDILLMQTIPVPSKAMQIQIAASVSRLETLEANINSIKSELAIHPESKKVREKLDEMLTLSGELTQSDKIKSLVLAGETNYTEFKSTFQLCLRENEKKEYITHSALKTIAGFLNTDGGTLLIGVTNDRQIPGVNNELKRFYKGSEDKYLLFVQDKINSALGYKALSNVSIDFVDIDGAAVLEVSCKSIEERDVFLNGKEYFARVPAGTKKLEGKEILNHINQKG